MKIADLLASRDADTPEFYELLIEDELDSEVAVFTEIGARDGFKAAADAIQRITQNSTAVLTLWKYAAGNGAPRKVWTYLVDHPENDLTNREFITKVRDVFLTEIESGISHNLQMFSILMEMSTGVSRTLWRKPKTLSTTSQLQPQTQRMLMFGASQRSS